MSIENLSHKLTEFMDEHLPIADKIGIEVESYDGHTLKLRAPLAPSINDKQTAFGGSMYCLCVMNCWGMVYLKCLENGIVPNIVIGKAEIEYKLPVAQDFISTCDNVDDSAWDAFFAMFKLKGRAKIRMESHIEIDGKPAVIFAGQYAIIGEK
jgi:thioesterase domain-containing protein